jgi:hypothetical protein
MHEAAAPVSDAPRVVPFPEQVAGEPAMSEDEALRALEARHAGEGNPRLTLVSDWRECTEQIEALLSGNEPYFLGRVGGSDTNAVVAHLTNRALGGDDPAHPRVLRHLDIVERYNGYYDQAHDAARFLDFLEALTDAYAASRNLLFCNHQLLSMYFPGNINERFRTSQFENRIGFQLLVNHVLGSRTAVSAYPYPFVEKLVSHPLSLMNVLARTLPGKRVLVVSPFSRSIVANFHNRRAFFRTYAYPEFDLLVYNTPITYAGLPAAFYPHANWFETTAAMTADIAALSFDVALLACGSYAMPIGRHIHETMGKQAIYVGGVLQLMFGVMGRRYENPFFRDQIDESVFIRPVEAATYLDHVTITPQTAHEAFGAYF